MENKKISPSDIQRHKDFCVIFDLCRYSDKYNINATCPLITKRCTEENCPLFFCVNLRDCDKAADITADNYGIY